MNKKAYTVIILALAIISALLAYVNGNTYVNSLSSEFLLFLALVHFVWIAYFDLRKRYIPDDLMFLVPMLCGTITGGDALQKAFCLIGLPLLCILALSLIGRRHRAENRSVLDMIGGADIKTIAVAGFFFGPVYTAAAALLSIVPALLFVKKPEFGADAATKERIKSEPGKAHIPFCSIFLTVIIVLWLVSFFCMDNWGAML